MKKEYIKPNSYARRVDVTSMMATSSEGLQVFDDDEEITSDEEILVKGSAFGNEGVFGVLW